MKEGKEWPHGMYRSGRRDHSASAVLKRVCRWAKCILEFSDHSSAVCWCCQQVILARGGLTLAGFSLKIKAVGKKKVEVTLEIYIAAHQPPLRVGMSHHLDVMGTFVQSAIQDFCRDTMRACSVAKSCPILCDPMGCGPPGSPVHRILQARILEWVAISSSRRSSWPRDSTCVSCGSFIGRRILYH